MSVKDFPNTYDTLTVGKEGAVLFAEIRNRPMNLLGTELVRAGRRAVDRVAVPPPERQPPLAERYGWINRALPADEIDDFVRTLAHRITGFPGQGQVAVKDRVNAITLTTDTKESPSG